MPIAKVESAVANNALIPCALIKCKTVWRAMSIVVVRVRLVQIKVCVKETKTAKVAFAMDYDVQPQHVRMALKINLKSMLIAEEAVSPAPLDHSVMVILIA